MNLSELFIRRPVMTTLFMLAIVLSGLAAYRALPVSDLPNVDYPSISVQASNPGASPEVMARTVARPIEKELLSIPGVEKVTSFNNTGRSHISVRFSADKSMDGAAQDVQAALSRAQMFLPKSMPRPPSYAKENPSQQPIMYLGLTSAEMSLADLHHLGSNFVEKRLSMVEGVASVTTYGTGYAVRIELDPDALVARAVTLEDVQQVLAQTAAKISGGTMEGDQLSLTVRSPQELLTPETLRNLVVAKRGSAEIRLGDLGRVEEGMESADFAFYHVTKAGREPAIVLAVQRQAGSNTVKISESIQKVLPSIQASLPASVTLNLFYDKAATIGENIVDVQLTLLIAFVLVILVIFFYLGTVRETLIPALALPISLIGTFGVMQLLGYSIDNLSLLALTLAIGFVVDDAIVVLENIVRHREEGKGPLEAALEGSREISFTVLSMTLSLVAVFIPMLLLGGVIGKLFREFAVVLAVSVLVSGVVSLTLTPMMSARFLSDVHRESALKRLSDGFNRALLAFYRPTLRLSLQWRWTTLLIGGLTLAVTCYLGTYLQVNIMPEDDLGVVVSGTNVHQSQSRDQTLTRLEQVDILLSQEPHVESFLSIYMGGHSGFRFITLKERSERPSAREVITQASAKLDRLPGVFNWFRPLPMLDLDLGGDNQRGGHQLQLKSLELSDLRDSVDRLSAGMRELPGFKNVFHDYASGHREMQIEVDRERANALGVSAQQIYRVVEMAFSETRAATLEARGEQFPIMLELDRGFKRSPEALSQLYVRSQSGKLIPLSTVAHWRETVGAGHVAHENGFPVINISYELDGDITEAEATAALARLTEELLPTTVIATAAGQDEVANAYGQQLWMLTLVAVLVIYFVLGVLYESFIHPITILSALPFAALGAVVALLAFGQPLSLYGFVGILLLIGIVKKNGIMMIDHALEQQREHALNAFDSIFEACIVRFRPIMMTTFAAIMGALPIAFGWGAGGEVRQTLGLVIVGGLLFSQLLTLYFTPALYLTFDRLQGNSKEAVGSA